MKLLSVLLFCISLQAQNASPNVVQFDPAGYQFPPFVSTVPFTWDNNFPTGLYPHILVHPVHIQLNNPITGYDDFNISLRYNPSWVQPYGIPGWYNPNFGTTYIFFALYFPGVYQQTATIVGNWEGIMPVAEFVIPNLPLLPQPVCLLTGWIPFGYFPCFGGDPFGDVVYGITISFPPGIITALDNTQARVQMLWFVPGISGDHAAFLTKPTNVVL